MTYWLKQLNTCPADGTKIALLKVQYKSRFGQARSLPMYICPKCRKTFVEYKENLIVSPFYKDILKDYLNWKASQKAKIEKKPTEEKKTACDKKPEFLLEYNGVGYSRNNQGKWLKDGRTVFSSLQKILDEIYFDKHADELKTIEEKLQMAENLYRNGSYLSAVSAYLGLMESLDEKQRTEAAEKICEGHRLSGDPDKTIEYYESIKDKTEITADILTSVAAAYLDLGIIKSARKMADHACNMYPFSKELPPSLVAVYEKLNKTENK